MKNQLLKINIVLLTDSLADLAGGAEKQIFELAKRLNKDKYNITVASLECVGQAPRYLIEEIGCRFMDFPVKRIYGFSGFIQGIRFWRFLKREKIHILQTYHFSSDIWGTFLARWAGVGEIISNRRDMGFWRGQRHIIAYKWINRWVDKIIVVSESIKRLIMTEEGVAEEKIKVIHNGVDLLVPSAQHSVTRLENEFGIKKEALVIMHIASLTPVKGHKYLLEAMAQLHPKYPKAKLVLIGDGLLRVRLEELVEQYGLRGHVLFLGKIENACQLLSRADICVLPSVSEGMSNAILEYMAAGKPVIATRVGGNPELVVDNETGILVDKENSEQITDAVSLLIDDLIKREEMGKRGSNRIKKHFTMPAMIEAYDDAFKRAVQRKNMRACLLVSSGGLFGAERVILNLAKNKNIHTFIGAIRNSHNPHLEVIDEGKKMGLDTIVFRSDGRFDMNTVFQIRRFLKEKEIDILHTHNYKSDIAGFLATRFTNTKWIATNHVWHGLDRKLRLYEYLDSYILRFAEKIIAVSEEIKNDLVSRRIPAEKVQVIDNGIDLDLFNKEQPKEQIKNDFNINKNEVVVAIVGRLSSEKGHETFLKAANEVLRKRSDIKFLVIGDGPIKENLQAESRRLQLNGNVIFTGIRNNMPAMYSMIDILVNASSIEGLPMTILEAMASKTALIVTPVGAVPHFIKHDVNGIIVNMGDYQEFARQICALADHPERYRNIINHAYHDVCENFNSQAMASRYEGIYQRTIQCR